MLLSHDSEHIYSAKLIHSYFNAEIKDLGVLKDVIGRFAPTFGYF